jgi:3-methyladenine DNA glycosylase/8-oxoguanine DNA glycosylase
VSELKANARFRGSRFRVKTPRDFLLHRDACSYGYFLLEPNRWLVREQVFVRTFLLGKLAVTARIAPESGKRGADLIVNCDAKLTAAQRRELIAQLTRMLRLDESAADIARFHKLDPRWKKLGNGRLCRSPSFFEDVIKTVTSCNVTWPSTVAMNRKLCLLLGAKSASGHRAFPTAAQLARTRPQKLRARCSVGYRDARIVELAKLFHTGKVDPAWFEDRANSDQAVREALLELPGIGPYAAANIMQLLGRYSHIALDTESVRHGRAVLGFTGSSARVMKRVAAHFEPFGDHKFRSYWFELRVNYEAKAGPAHTWDYATSASTFTSRTLTKDSRAKKPG